MTPGQPEPEQQARRVYAMAPMRQVPVRLAQAAVQAVAGESEISRAGRHFIVGPLADKAVADKVAEAVMQQNASLEVKIAEIVE